MNNPIAEFYRSNPRMVSSPFGGVDGINQALFCQVLDRLGIGLGGRTLDVGCGRGFAEEVVVEAGGQYYGVDLVTSRRGFPLALADSCQLPFPSETFDLVMCVDAFEHFPDAVGAAREFRRMLRPGGVFFLSAPNYANVAGLVKRFSEMTGAYARDTWAPFGRWQPQEFERPLTPRSVVGTFKKGGFTRYRRIGHGPEVGLGLFPWMDHPKMPEAIQFRLQRLFGAMGPAIAARWPGASLHNFWKIEP